MAKSDQKFAVAIDQDVIREIFEYLVKEGSNIGNFSLSVPFFDKKIGRFVSYGVTDKFLNGFYMETSKDKDGVKRPIILGFKGRDAQPPMESFRQSRMISKVMEKLMKDGKHEVSDGKKTKTVVSPKKKKTAMNIEDFTEDDMDIPF